jgi:hypothetical protein
MTLQPRRTLCAILGVMLAAVLAPPARAFPGPAYFWVLPLRPDAVDDTGPRISGRSVVWQKGSGSAAEIWLYNQQGFHQLTLDGQPDEMPEIDGSIVVWQHQDGQDYEVMRFDGATTSYFTNNNVDDLCPVPSAGFVGWQGTGAAGKDFFLSPNSPTPQITGDAGLDECPVASGGNYAWSKLAGGDRNVWAWFSTGGSPGLYQITSSATEEASPAISGNLIAFVSGIGAAADIELFDLGIGYTIPVTTDGFEDRNPQVDGNRIVWEHFDGSDWEILQAVYAGNGTALVPQFVTNNLIDDHSPVVSGDTVVWVADEPGGSHLWTSWHGGPPRRVTTLVDNEQNPRIEGDLIAFESCGPSGCDIVLAPEPAAGALGAAALGLLAALAALARPA